MLPKLLKSELNASMSKEEFGLFEVGLYEVLLYSQCVTHSGHQAVRTQFEKAEEVSEKHVLAR